MIFFLRRLLLLVACTLSIQMVYAQFPYIESFRNNTAPGIIFGGAPSAFLTAAGSGFDGTTHTGTPIDANGNGYLRLTSNDNNQKGYAISTANFPSANGLSVMFEYYIYGGTGADGISFFLFDATAGAFQPGGFGGSLGYAQYTSTTPASPGVSKGYLAIGLDEYGNFSNPIEGRVGGIPGLRPQSITLRGKGDGMTGYDFLTTEKMEDHGFQLVGDGAARQPDETNPGYRRVFMDMAPNTNGGYNITVRVTKGGSPTVTATVISNYYYPEAAPANLRYGFASSTGFQTNFHEIRNVKIDAYDVNGLTDPIAVNDVLSVCQGKQAIIDVAANDRTSNPGATMNKASIDLDPNVVGIQNSFTVAGKGVFSLNSAGSVQFIPEPAFSGTVSCSYNIKDTFGKLSNAATITLTYIAAPAQPSAGPDQTLNFNTTLGNAQLTATALPTGTTGKWTQISGPNTAGIAAPNANTTAVTNLATGTYLFRWTITSAAGCESTDDVVINVTTNPNGVIVAPDLTVHGTAGQPGTIPLTKPPGTTITITVPPTHGTVTVDPITGEVIYTPDPNFSGEDTFIYIIKDGNGNQSNPGKVTIIVDIPARIGVAKRLVSKVRNADGSHDLTYTFLLRNYSTKDGLIGVSLTDDLEATFKQNTVVVKKITATGTLVVNPAYNGFSDKQLLKTSSTLAKKTEESVTIEINVLLDKIEGTFNNTAFAQGNSTLDNTLTTDQSTDGLKPDPLKDNDVSPAQPTPVTLNKEEIFIPGGFSPNGDGINDYFVIENNSGKQILLEVYNRWANRIYRSANYKNEWNGKTTEGIHVGEDVPTGTYYYIVIIDGKDKRVGHLTITR
jgi:gliding motility-associated-like protein